MLDDGENKTTNAIPLYSRISTVAGMANIGNNETHMGKLYWSLSVISLLSLGTYWSQQAYSSWQQNPVLTTPSSTSIPINSFKFPSVTFCTEGFPSTVFIAGFIEEIKEAMIKYGGRKNFPETPIETAKRYVNGTIIPRMFYQASVNGTDLLSFLYPVATYQLKKFSTIEDVISYFNGFLSERSDAIIISYLAPTFVYTHFPSNPGEAVLRLYFDPAISSYKQYFKDRSVIIIDILTNSQIKELFRIFLPHVRRTKVPCFDIPNITAEADMDASMLKNCHWKGVSMNCATIFSAITTDDGLCCSFNVQKAETVFVSSYFSRIMRDLQAKEKANAFGNTTAPDWYVKGKEPISRQGIKLGLQVTLDSHSEIFKRMSVDTNFNSFKALIFSQGDFPVTEIRSIRIMKGQHTLVSLRGIIISGDESLRSISPTSRGCYFSGEKKLKYFKEYSQFICMFECFVRVAQQEVLNYTHYRKYSQTDPFTLYTENRTCLPWYSPLINDAEDVCNTQSAYVFKNNFMKNIAKNSCLDCLPDCQRQIYDATITHEPFRKCDDLNIGSSFLCNIKRKNITRPSHFEGNLFQQLWRNTTMIKFRHGIYYKNHIFSGVVFDKTIDDYDAYDRDIGIVSIFFDSASVWMFSVQASSTYLIYFSNVGGLYGLCIGFSLVTLVEIFWLVSNSLLDVVVNTKKKMTKYLFHNE